MVLIIVALIACAQALGLAYIARMNRHVDEINTAVNHKDHGMPTLVQRVVSQDERSIQLAAELDKSDRWRNEAIQSIATELGIRLKAPPAPVAPIESVIAATVETLTKRTEEEVAAGVEAEALTQ